MKNILEDLKHQQRLRETFIKTCEKYLEAGDIENFNVSLSAIAAWDHMSQISNERIIKEGVLQKNKEKKKKQENKED